MVDYPDIINYSREELIEEYCKLFDRYQDLRESCEADTQKIHELKRSLETATAAQVFLSQELEQYTNIDNAKVESDLRKTQAELVDLKKKYGQIEASFATLQQDYNALLDENTKLSQNLEETLKNKRHIPTEVETNISEENLLRIQTLENENMELLQKIEDFEERTVCYTLTIAEYEKNIEILRDQIKCLEENLQSKRVDLEEKLQILESTQEQLAEANAKLSMLSTTPNSDDHKGNSLFAEVDDQRQAMKQLLAAQKKSYGQMKKVYNDSKYEIRRLKRENIAMHTELEACSSIFCNADKIYQEKLNERIRHLLNQNEDLERKIKWTQDRLKELASEKGVLWVDSMLSFCKKETDDLKSHLHSVYIQKASLEEQLRNSQQDMARWRFESLKSRCILLDREHLLTENKITFRPLQAMEYHVSAKELRESRPRIVHNRRSSIFENITDRRSMTPLDPVKQKVEIQTQKCIKNETIDQSDCPDVAHSITPSSRNKNKIKLNHCEQNKDEQKSITPDEELSCANDVSARIAEQENTKTVIESKPNDNENKENDNNIAEEYLILDNNFAKLQVKPPSPMRPSQKLFENATIICEHPAKSILTKQNDLIYKNSCKNVKFSSKDDIIHTPPPNSTTTTSKKDNSSTMNNLIKTTVKQPRTKSNVVVRRVVVSSKHH